MKKISRLLFYIMGMALAFSSCTKEDIEKVDHSWSAPGNWSPNVFTATSANSGSKTSMNDSYMMLWSEGDQINVTNSDQTITYSIRTINGTGGTATFSVPEGSQEILSGPYTATYPANFDGQTITLPERQIYNATNRLVNFPMYAQSNTRELQFHNMCGVLELTMVQNGIRVKEIIISTDEEISGTFNVGSVTENGEEIKCIKSDGAVDGQTSKRVILDCGSGVSISNSTKFYIYLPVASFTRRFDIEIVTTSGAYTLQKLNTTTPLEFNRNHVKKISFSGMTFRKPPEKSVRGLYSVSATQRVYFSHGNLFFRIDSRTRGGNFFTGYYYTYTGTWGFYEKQYGGWQYGAQFDEFEPSASGGTYNNYAQTDAVGNRLSYFSWGYNSNPTKYNSNTSSSTWAEWGSQTAISREVGTNWRTLTDEEWRYLMNTRTMAFGAPRYVRARLLGVDKLSDDDNPAHSGITINVRGLLLYPDRYPTNDQVNYPYYADNINNWTDIDAATWAKMESAGCVFLPGTGYRLETTIKAHGEGEDNMYGLYQSKSKYPSNSSYYDGFRPGIIYGLGDRTLSSYSDMIGHLANGCAHNVRLVIYEQDVPTETQSPVI